MRLLEFFAIDEGAMDVEFRREAQEVFDLVRGMRRSDIEGAFVNVRQVPGPKGVHVVATYDLSDRLTGKISKAEYPELKLAMSLYLENPGHLGRFSAPAIFGEIPTIELCAWVGDSSSLPSPVTWRKNLEKEWDEQVSSHRTTFIHEYTHYLDYRDRYPSKFVQVYDSGLNSKKHGGEDGAYYNSPHETNAFFQMTFDEVEQQLPDLVAATGRDPEPKDVYDMVVQQLGDEYMKKLSDKNKKKLAKRAHQLWSDWKSGR